MKGLNKLFNSAKFWAITFGAILGSTIYYILGDQEGLSSGFVMLLVGSYAGIAALGKGEDIVKANRNNKDGI